jgi:hypothetical protein
MWLTHTKYRTAINPKVLQLKKIFPEVGLPQYGILQNIKVSTTDNVPARDARCRLKYVYIRFHRQWNTSFFIPRDYTFPAEPCMFV